MWLLIVLSYFSLFCFFISCHILWTTSGTGTGCNTLVASDLLRNPWSINQVSYIHAEVLCCSLEIFVLYMGWSTPVTFYIIWYLYSFYILMCFVFFTLCFVFTSWLCRLCMKSGFKILWNHNHALISIHVVSCSLLLFRKENVFI